jgi:hypothetical protein
MLKSVAFVCNKLDNGLSEEQIFDYTYLGDIIDKRFVKYCIDFSIENKWLERRKDDDDRYSLTPLGREFILSQIG